MNANLTDAVNNAIPFALASAVATSGTVTVGYPGTVPYGYSKGNYLLSNGQHKLQIGQNIYSSPTDFTCTFNANASSITVTNKSAQTWPAGSIAALQLNLSGVPTLPPNSNVVANSAVLAMRALGLDLGSPNVGATTGLAAAQAVATAKNLTLSGANIVSSIGYADVPRAVQVTSSSASDTAITATIRGLDDYQQALTETITFNGAASVVGKKAFAQVNSIAISAAAVGNISAGFSNVIGLPLAVWKAGQVIKELQDGAVATAGTFAYADQSTPTATTGDVRGTYIPNATPDGSKGFLILAFIPDPSDVGVTNYTA